MFHNFQFYFGARVQWIIDSNLILDHVCAHGFDNWPLHLQLPLGGGLRGQGSIVAITDISAAGLTGSRGQLAYMATLAGSASDPVPSLHVVSGNRSRTLDENMSDYQPSLSDEEFSGSLTKVSDSMGSMMFFCE
jgi:hypothetical protein